MFNNSIAIMVGMFEIFISVIFFIVFLCLFGLAALSCWEGIQTLINYIGSLL